MAKPPTCDRCGTGFYRLYGDEVNLCSECNNYLNAWMLEETYNKNVENRVAETQRAAEPLINWINTGNAKLQSNTPE